MPDEVKNKIPNKLNKKLNLMQALRSFDYKKGVACLECQKLMGCSDKDVDEYVSFAKAQGEIFEQPSGTLRVLE
jgi:hypothetical protein